MLWITAKSIVWPISFLFESSRIEQAFGVAKSRYNTLVLLGISLGFVGYLFSTIWGGVTLWSVASYDAFSGSVTRYVWVIGAVAYGLALLSKWQLEQKRPEGAISDKSVTGIGVFGFEVCQTIFGIYVFDIVWALLLGAM